jgi:hypothetical protein
MTATSVNRPQRGQARTSNPTVRRINASRDPQRLDAFNPGDWTTASI